jgi:pimeloyl-ACP methyl ester carboxylesterase
MSGSRLSYDRSGAGEPLVLVHANGMSRAAWDPVLPFLEPLWEVIAVDLPGHGDSPPIAPHLAPAPPGFARVIASLVDELGIERAHVAGNSLGGWTALELAKLGRARSVCALGPAGLWKRGPIGPVIALALPHLAARRWPGPIQRAMRIASVRAVCLRRAFGRPGSVPPDDAVRLVADLANAPGFLPTLFATHARGFSGGRDIEAPVTIVFGQRDRVVPRSARRPDELPEHSYWLEPAGLGHVPMWDDPRAVANVITRAASARR